MIDIFFGESMLEAQHHRPVGIIVGGAWMLYGESGMVIEMLHVGDRRRSVDSHCKRVRERGCLHGLVEDCVQHGGDSTYQISRGDVAARSWLAL